MRVDFSALTRDPAGSYLFMRCYGKLCAIDNRRNCLIKYGQLFGYERVCLGDSWWGIGTSCEVARKAIR